MLFSAIDILDEELNVQKNQYVGVKDGRIAYIGSEKPVEDFGEIYDGGRKLLMPGMYNAHAHSPMTLLRGYAENLPLDRWLNEKVFPFEAKITDVSATSAINLAMAEMLRFGTVSFSDMYYFSEACCEAVLAAGMKTNLCYTVINFSNEPFEKLPAFAECESLVKNFHNTGEGRVKIETCIHAEYTNTPETIREVGAWGKALGLGNQVHVSETKKEQAECLERHGKTPAALFAELGYFDRPTTAAHCVWLSDEDFAILKGHGVSVATNPASNLKLGSGFADIPKMLDFDINVALGTDSVASNNSLNMFKEMYLLALLHKGTTNDPTVLTPKQALAIATRNGAKAQQREDCGVIRVGNRADLVVLDVDVPWMKPVSDLLTNIVYSAQGSDVCLTMVDGKVLYKDGEYPTIDVEKAAFETQAARDAIVASL